MNLYFITRYRDISALFIAFPGVRLTPKEMNES